MNLNLTIPQTRYTRRVRIGAGHSTFNGYYASLTIADDLRGVNGFMLFAFARTRRGCPAGRARWEVLEAVGEG